MPVMTEYAPGTFSWIELNTSDPAAAKTFYGKLFGWEFKDDDIPGGGVYTMVSLKGQAVAGLTELREEMKQQNIPTHWMSYVTVANADEVVAKVQAAGGAVHAPAFDVMDAGRMAVFADPDGAAFCVWQPNKHIGAGLVNEHGSLMWNELLANNPDTCEAFYASVFGWTTESFGDDYKVFMDGKRPCGGLMKPKAEWGEMPSNWFIYFAVDDCDASLATANEAGAKVYGEAFDIPQVGRLGILCDPTGGWLGICQPEPQQD